MYTVYRTRESQYSRKIFRVHNEMQEDVSMAYFWYLPAPKHSRKAEIVSMGDLAFQGQTWCDVLE